jgi:hypothetical protein
LSSVALCTYDIDAAAALVSTAVLVENQLLHMREEQCLSTYREQNSLLLLLL